MNIRLSELADAIDRRPAIPKYQDEICTIPIRKPVPAFDDLGATANNSTFDVITLKAVKYCESPKRCWLEWHLVD